MAFDYCLPAELFVGRRKSRARQQLGYRRFATAAEAIRFAVEDFPAVRTLGAWMQVGDDRSIAFIREATIPCPGAQPKTRRDRIFAADHIMAIEYGGVAPWPIALQRRASEREQGFPLPRLESRLK
jgi:hypothetical protein